MAAFRRSGRAVPVRPGRDVARTIRRVAENDDGVVMVSIPNWEKPPGIKEPWLQIWRLALKAMKESGTWSPPMRPLLDEYVTALRTAREHRLLAEIDPVEENRESGLTHMHAGFVSASKHLADARALADLLGLTPKAQKALAEKAEEKPDESSAFAAADKLARGHAPARRRRVTHS